MTTSAAGPIASRPTERDDAAGPTSELPLAPLQRRMERHFSAVIAAAGIQPATARCRIERDGSSLEVHIDLPEAVSQGVEHALAVRVLDAVHSHGRTFGDVNVYVHTGKLTQ